MLPAFVLPLLTNRYVIAAAAGIALVAGAWWWHSSRVDRAVDAALEAQKAVYTAELLEAEKKARETERAHAERLAAIGTHYQKEFQTHEAQRLRDVAAARDGALRLRVPGTLCPDAGPAPGAAAGRGDGAEGGELPPAVTADLLQLVHDADRNTRQLAACQAVIESDRKDAP